MERDSKLYTLLDAAPVRAITSSTDATPIVITTAAVHGKSSGDHVLIFGHTTNIAANGTYKITVVSTTKFSLQNIDSGADIAGSGAGAGANGSFCPAPKRVLLQDARHAVFSFDTDGGGDAAMTVKPVGAITDDCPDFAKAKGPSNSYEYIQMADYEDGSVADGDDGFVVASADDNRFYEANVNGLEWLSVVPTAGTAGEITVRVRIFSSI